MRAPSETREKLLQTAIDLVWQSNYCSVGVAEICARAGVTKGAFCDDRDGYLFWDPLHPTKKVHALFAAQALAALPVPD